MLATSSPLLLGSVYALLAGLTIFAGAGLAHSGWLRHFNARASIQHALVAMGAGALVSAVAFVLIPEATAHQPPAVVLVAFVLGGLGFMGIDARLARSESPLSQFLAMLLDFVPEVIALGVLVSQGASNKAAFVALIIAVQNFPEGFSAYEDMSSSRPLAGKRRLLAAFFAVSLIGPPLMYLGATVLADHPAWVSILMSFSAGGILFLVFQDIAPKVPLKHSGLPSMFAVLGFAVGLCGYLFAS